ncbi:MAG: type III pantothenate kinase [Bdellovibrionales bacterium]|nr:type III pantothenate kinase [Bdellovibrionales bacterium]
MLLTLDVGNSQIFGGVFRGDEIIQRFRMTSAHASTSDEYGLFLRSALRENELNPDDITGVAICSVVPDKLHSLKNCCTKYFNLEPFILQAGVKTGLKIKYRNPLEVGADRIADAIAASFMYPDEDLIVIDFGTATTLEVITRDSEFLGGAILPGVRISMETLEQRTARLPSVEIIKTNTAVGRSTTESIQSGLFYGHLGAVKELIQRISEQNFSNKRPRVIGTGGFASLFESSGLFDVEEPDLVLKGLYLANQMNLKKEERGVL